jgi:sugar lactone lactonase YvrE
METPVMSPRNWLRSLLSNLPCTPARRPRPRLAVESLEHRDVPSALSVSDISAREGPTATGILDPSGAAVVGLDGPRGITFDNAPVGTPGYQHEGDLFVTGYLSHSVARFDWATQTYQPFVAPGSGGLGTGDPATGDQGPCGIAVGPDGNLYVSDTAQNTVYRYDGATGAPLPAPGQMGAVFVPASSGGLTQAKGVAFGADGNLYVVSYTTKQILEYQGPAGSSPGAFMAVFASVPNGAGPNDLTFGPDGNLYVCVLAGGGVNGGQIDRYDGSTGAPIGSGVFVAAGSGGLAQPRQFVFDATGANMYVVECRSAGRGVQYPGGPMGEVLRYQGPNAPNPGAFVESYVTAGQGGLSRPFGLARDPDGNLYVSDMNATANVTRFAPSSNAAFQVTLDSASTSPVSVNYATANGTAVAGTDYTQTSGTLTFAPGVTTQTVTVPINTVLTGGPTKTFALNLSGPVNATIADGMGVGSILNRVTKFFVADGSTSATFEYGSGGTSEENTELNTSSNTAPRGAASTAAGDKVWVADANRNVYVYDNHGVLLGSWAAGSLASNATVEGITVWGSDVWLVDARQDRVYRYAGAATRLSGSQNATSYFALNGSNASPKDLVTDGTSIWVVNDSSTDKVFEYTLSGSLLGSWTMSGGGGSPTGITLDPTGASQDLWVVDNATDKVYDYAAARSRTSGSQMAAAPFALNAYNTNPQGIADPPLSGDSLPAVSPQDVVPVPTSTKIAEISFPPVGTRAVVTPSARTVLQSREVHAPIVRVQSFAPGFAATAGTLVADAANPPAPPKSSTRLFTRTMPPGAEQKSKETLFSHQVAAGLASVTRSWELVDYDPLSDIMSGVRLS